MRSIVTTLMELLGLVLVVVGLLIALGVGWGLVAAGLVMLLLGFLLRPSSILAGDE
jgi:hypothetical protein